MEYVFVTVSSGYDGDFIHCAFHTEQEAKQYFQDYDAEYYGTERRYSWDMNCSARTGKRVSWTLVADEFYTTNYVVRRVCIGAPEWNEE